MISEPESADNRVALFLPSLASGGAERVFVELAGLFAARGLAVDIVVVSSQGSWSSLIPDNVRLVDLKKCKPSRAISALIMYLREVRPNAIISALTHANIVLAIAYRLSGVNCRCVLSERASTIALFKEKSAWDYLLTKILCQRVYCWAHSVVAVSYGVSLDVIETLRVPKNRLSVIYNPIMQEKIFSMGLEPIKFPWDDELPVIISIGRLQKQKDFISLIRAFSRVRSEMPSYLVILGEGDERVNLEAEAENLGIIKYIWMPGFVENPYAYLANANLMVLSSGWEGLPNVLIESLLLNVPIVSTACPSGPEEILDNGRYGRLVPVGDVAALADAMLSSLSGNHPQFDPREALARFHPDRIVSQYLQVLGIHT